MLRCARAVPIFLVFQIAAILSAVQSVAAPGDALERAFALAAQGDWPAAEEAALADGRVARDMIVWQRLRQGRGELAEYLDFFDHRGHWPGLKLMRRKGEPLIPADAEPADVLRFFGDNQPQTGAGALRLVAAYEALRRRGDAQVEAVLAWRTLDMSAAEEAAFLERYGDWLKGHHEARVDMLLWAGKTQAAERLLPLVGDGWRKLAAARIALRRNRGGVDGLIAAVPVALRDDPGLAYERFRWRIKRGRTDDAIELMLTQSRAEAGLGEAERWASRRRTYARARMRDGAAETAYELASRHGLSEGQNYADLEWLSGYIALRYLDDPALAREHFTNFRNAVWTPISLGRAGYWLGRAEEALGNAEAAQAAYRFGARYQTSFYGLLAAERAGVPMDPGLAVVPEPPDWRQMPFAGDDSAVAAKLFLATGRRTRAAQFLSHLAEEVPEEQFGAFVEMVRQMGDPYLLVVVGKQAARRGIVVPQAYFGQTDLGLKDNPVPLELALAIARRESEFNETVVSPAGARGLMQLMPGTARLMARKLGEDYSLDALTSDPAYNARLGTAYLEQLIEEFGLVVPLVAAGYNAGPGRPRGWMERFGDPRMDDVDAVDWIEHIPFRETRNYVMRVMEAMIVYQAQLAKKPLPIRLSDVLKGL